MAGIPSARITPSQEEQLKALVGFFCELCREFTPASDLASHPIPGANSRDLQRDILILCSECTTHIRSLEIPEEKQRRWAAQRSFALRKGMRTILGSTLPSYTPPEITNLEELYEEACRTWITNGSG